MITVKVFTFNPVQENTYLLYTESGDCCIIDPGCYFEEERQEMLEFVKQNNLKPSLLLNTHCHFDHVFGNQFVYETWGLEAHIHPMEQAVLDRSLEAAMRWQLSFEPYRGAIKYIGEENPVRWAGEEFQVLHVPGHSPGSVAFYHARQAFVIAGDVLFQGSIGRTDLPGGDYSTLEKSILEKMYKLPFNTVVYPGHGYHTRIETEAKSNPFVKLVSQG